MSGHPGLRRLLSLTTLGVTVARRRGRGAAHFFVRRRPRTTALPAPAYPRLAPRALAFLLTLLLLCAARHAAADPPPGCEVPGTGWCLVRRFPGPTPGGELGFRFGEPLDVDGDGTADVAAGSRFTKEGIHQNGLAGVWSGATGAPIRTWPGPFTNGLFGHWVLSVPDLDGDGLADVVIAAPNAGVADVMSGVLVTRSPKRDREIWRRSGATLGQFGWDLALAGDQNGDGRVDLFVGAPATDGGKVHLVSGTDGAVLRTYAPSVRTASFGWHVARIDDLDGDRLPDLAVGAPPGFGGDDPPNGAAYVFGSASGLELRRMDGPAPGAGFGEQVAALGDLDRDGRGEVVVAAPGSNDQTRGLAGEVVVYSGAPGGEIRRWRGAQRGALYGRLVTNAGDVDGDGTDDLAIGAPWYRRGRDDRVGRLEIRSGRNGAVLGGLEGETAESWFGWHARRAPDPEGRGRPALLVGSLRQAVDGKSATGVIDWWVLRR